MDPRDLVGEEVGEMDVEDEVAVAVVEPEEPGAVDTLVAGVFEKVAVGVFTATIQAKVKQWIVSVILNNLINL